MRAEIEAIVGASALDEREVRDHWPIRMRWNQSVPSHRACGFAAGAALLPGIGFIDFVSPNDVLASVRHDKVMAGETPANPAALVSD